MSDEKVTTTRLSTKSWHYKLLHYVLGKNAPTPQNMYNLCPYFWLVMFSILTVPFVFPVKETHKFINKLSNKFDGWCYVKCTIPSAEKWYKNLDDLYIYTLYNIYNYMPSKYKDYLLNKYYDKESCYTRQIEMFVADWIKEKYGKNIYRTTKAGHTVNTKWFDNWLKEQRVAYDEYLDKLSTVYTRRRNFVYNIKEKQEKLDKWVSVNWNKLLSYKNIIKWTKRITGAIITLAGLVATYYILVVTSILITILFDAFKTLLGYFTWSGLGWGLLYIGGAVILGFIIYKTIRWFQHREEIPLFAKPFYYLIYIPLDYILFYGLYSIVLLNTWYFIKRIAIGTWKSFKGFLGIFGEYFGSAYTDYCPGIEWEEDQDSDDSPTVNIDPIDPSNFPTPEELEENKEKIKEILDEHQKEED